MKIVIHHRLSLSLGAPARAVEHLLLSALTTPQQKVERWTIEMAGFAEAATFRDGYGNRAHLVSQTKPESELVITVSGAVETFDKAGVLGRLELDPMPAVFRRPTALTPKDAELIEGVPDAGGRIALLHELMERVHERARGSVQSQSQDGQSQSQGLPDPAPLSHAFIGAARALDIPARYVTGYLLDDDLARVHAWAEAWDEGLGWIGFDPVLNVCPADNYVRLASGLDASSAASVRSVPVGEIAQSVELVGE